MRQKRFYLILAVLGCVVPYYFFVSFLKAHGLDWKAFVGQLFGTPISTFFATDFLISCVVFIVYFRREAARYSMPHRWVYVAALLMVGLSFAWPLFLFAREDLKNPLQRQSDE